MNDHYFLVLFIDLAISLIAIAAFLWQWQRAKHYKRQSDRFFHGMAIQATNFRKWREVIEKKGEDIIAENLSLKEGFTLINEQYQAQGKRMEKLLQGSEVSKIEGNNNSL